ncbi:hypothetical protein NPIL_639871 [Nephila pilipes]|uniref:Uncharacterized protein n=1 Tax=Nephila pilipes TaxID=299642 RepID=A0A8X6JUC6_NEPPI|nr:hypothetical protein NPIL_639871 [Nephila pilipes]
MDKQKQAGTSQDGSKIEPRCIRILSSSSVRLSSLTRSCAATSAAGEYGGRIRTVNHSFPRNEAELNSTAITGLCCVRDEIDSEPETSASVKIGNSSIINRRKSYIQRTVRRSCRRSLRPLFVLGCSSNQPILP